MTIKRLVTFQLRVLAITTRFATKNIFLNIYHSILYLLFMKARFGRKAGKTGVIYAI